MKQVYKFLQQLARNNNREWFNAHKADYLKAKATFDSFTQELMAQIYKFDNDINPDALSLNDCTWRIYRDTRFSKDKTPYKTHFGAYFAKGGKKSTYGGYYFHIEPDQGGDYSFGNMLCVGPYMPTPKQIASIRDEIMLNGDLLLKAVKEARGFELWDEPSYKKVPRGYESVTNPELQKLLKLKQYLILKPVSTEYIFKDNLVKRVAAEFKKCHNFLSIINRCLEYALEEEKGL